MLKCVYLCVWPFLLENEWILWLVVSKFYANNFVRLCVAVRVCVLGARKSVIVVNGCKRCHIWYDKDVWGLMGRGWLLVLVCCWHSSLIGSNSLRLLRHAIYTYKWNFTCVCVCQCMFEYKCSYAIVLHKCFVCMKLVWAATYGRRILNSLRF